VSGRLGVVTLDGLKILVPRRRRGVTVTVNGLFIPGGLAKVLPGKTCRFLWDGGTLFALEAAGADGDLQMSGAGSTVRIGNNRMCAFVRDKLGCSRDERVELEGRIVDGALVFGIFDGGSKG